ncbi:MAG: tripartite tricarboxylate transporter substrate binding protein, partial [Betaproteobacteria bacterium]|nr:tripartite tricarboxylate transporter substrate binding protein [Betaproteobacteria bacterium]
SAESVTALLGGHVDLVTSGASFLAGQFRQGTLRLLALAAPRRGAGVLATVPTWREQGHDIVSDNFRNVLAPAGIDAQQVRYWEDAFAKLARTDEWRKDLEANLWENTYMSSSESRKYLDAQYAQLRQILADLGLAK